MIGRREFVGAIAMAGGLLPFAQGQRKPQANDPTLDAMLAEMNALKLEGDANPSKRKSVMQSAEVLLGVLSTYHGQHYDQQLKANIKRLGKDRRAFVQDLTTKINKPEVTQERVEAAIKKLETGGLQEALLDARKTLKTFRENAPDAVFVKYAQWYGCEGLQWEMQLIQEMAGIACTLSVAFGGTNAAADGACITMGTLAALFQGVLWWYGC